MQERLEREFSMNLITTAPTVVYEIISNEGVTREVENPSKLPEPSRIKEFREP